MLRPHNSPLTTPPAIEANKKRGLVVPLNLSGAYQGKKIKILIIPLQMGYLLGLSGEFAGLLLASFTLNEELLVFFHIFLCDSLIFTEFLPG